MEEIEVKSCIYTLNMLRRLALNIHGVIDVVDNENINTIIKVLEKQNPKKPNERILLKECPDCGTLVECKQIDQKIKYCINCGQRIDWSE
jgi:acetyl-CoA carboxylase beta subunit